VGSWRAASSRITARQAQVQQQQRGSQFGHQRQRRFAIGRFAHAIQVSFQVENQPKTLPHHGMVFCDDDSGDVLHRLNSDDCH
jgi:radical SAM superfamily enzyme